MESIALTTINLNPSKSIHFYMYFKLIASLIFVKVSRGNVFRCQGVTIKTTMTRTAVRETFVSRYHELPIEGPSETPRSSQKYGTEVFKGGLY